LVLRTECRELAPRSLFGSFKCSLSVPADLQLRLIYLKHLNPGHLIQTKRAQYILTLPDVVRFADEDLQESDQYLQAYTSLPMI
jgi:hypothetical protein